MCIYIHIRVYIYIMYVCIYIMGWRPGAADPPSRADIDLQHLVPVSFGRTRNANGGEEKIVWGIAWSHPSLNHAESVPSCWIDANCGVTAERQEKKDLRWLRHRWSTMRVKILPMIIMIADLSLGLEHGWQLPELWWKPWPRPAKQCDRQSFVTWAPPQLLPKPESADIMCIYIYILYVCIICMYYMYMINWPINVPSTRHHFESHCL